MSIKDPNDYLYYSAEATIEDVTYSLAAGGKLKLGLEHPDDYRAFESITKRSGKRAGQVLLILHRPPPDEDEDSEAPFSELEGWFAGWTVSHKNGAVLAITLKDEGFDAMRIRGKGEHIEIVVYQIEDDGDHYNEDERRRVEAKLKGGVLSIQAGKACQDLGFHRFLERATGRQPGEITGPDDAATIVRSHCGVESRAELDHDQKAAGRWRLLYKRWLGENL